MKRIPNQKWRQLSDIERKAIIDKREKMQPSRAAINGLKVKQPSKSRVKFSGPRKKNGSEKNSKIVKEEVRAEIKRERNKEIDFGRSIAEKMPKVINPLPLDSKAVTQFNDTNKVVTLTIIAQNLALAICDVITTGFGTKASGIDTDQYIQIYQYCWTAFQTFPSFGLYPKIILEMAAALSSKCVDGITYIVDKGSINTIAYPSFTSCGASMTGWNIAGTPDSNGYYPSIATPSATIVLVQRLLSKRGLAFDLIDASSYNDPVLNPFFSDCSAFSRMLYDSSTSRPACWNSNGTLVSCEYTMFLEIPIRTPWLAALELTVDGGTTSPIVVSFRRAGRDKRCKVFIVGSPSSNIYMRMKYPKDLKMQAYGRKVIFKYFDVQNFCQRICNTFDTCFNLNGTKYSLTGFDVWSMVMYTFGILAQAFAPYAGLFLGVMNNEQTATYALNLGGPSNPTPNGILGVKMFKWAQINLNALRPRIVGDYMHVAVPQNPSGGWTVSTSNVWTGPYDSKTITGWLPAQNICVNANWPTVMKNFTNYIPMFAAGIEMCDYTEDDNELNFVDTVLYMDSTYSYVESISSSHERREDWLASLYVSYELPTDGNFLANNVYFDTRDTYEADEKTTPYFGITGSNSTLGRFADELSVFLSASVSNIKTSPEEVSSDNNFNSQEPDFLTKTIGDANSKILALAESPDFHGHNIPVLISKVFPKYGNYGGPNHGDPLFKEQPIDSLDLCFMHHDKAYMNLKNKNDVIKADQQLLNEINKLPEEEKGFWSKMAYAIIQFKLLLNDSYSLHDELK